MPKQEKIEELENLKESFKRSQSVLFADYSSFAVSEMQTLRDRLKNLGAEFKVVKNTFLKMASGVQFEGPTAVMFSFKDPLQPIKEFIKVSKELNKGSVKGGIFEGQPVTENQITELAAIPARENLYARLVSSINSPIANLVFALKNNQQRLVLVLNKAAKTGKSQ